jgi:hypothetical protein
MSLFRTLNLAPAALALALVGPPVLAQEEASTETDDSAPEEAQETQETQETQEAQTQDPAFPRLDLGLASGFNSPSGTIGLETNFRLVDYVGVGVVGGAGAWGWRITPQVRFYPFGVSSVGLFLEGGLSLNLGGIVYTNPYSETDATVLDLTPTLTTALGYRFPFRNNKAWGLLRVGYAFRLNRDNIHAVDGGPANPDSTIGLGILQHEGILLSAGFGLALF